MMFSYIRLSVLKPVDGFIGILLASSKQSWRIYSWRMERRWGNSERTVMVGQLGLDLRNLTV